MGTLGTGPLHSYTALDLVDTLVMSESDERHMLLARALTNALLANSVTDDLHIVLQQGVAACAVIADAMHGKHLYTTEPEDAEDFHLDMVEVTPELIKLARLCLERTWILRTRPDTPAWRSATKCLAYEDELLKLSNLLEKT
jgi:hypothetical protein